MIMPASAMMPSMAMKPMGVPVVSSAATTPMSPSGATLITSASWRKLPSCTMSAVSMSAIMSGTWARRAALLWSLFSTVPPVFEQCARRHRRAHALERGGDALVHEATAAPRQRLRLHGDGGQAAAAPDVALIELVLERRELAERHRGACRRRDLEIASRLRCSTARQLSARATTIDEID